MNEHRLDEAGFLPEPVRAALRARWIESAEQWLGACAEPSARRAMADTLGLPLGDLEALLARVRAWIGAPAGGPGAWETPRPGGALGLDVPDAEQRGGTGDGRGKGGRTP